MHRTFFAFLLFSSCLYAQDDDGSAGALRIPKQTFAGLDKVGPIAGAANGEIKASIRPYMPVPKDQGKLNSCAAFAVAYATKTYMERRRQGWTDDAPNHVYSPAFMFDIAALGNSQCPGIYIRNALGDLQGGGVCSWQTWPYDGTVRMLGNDSASMGAWNEAFHTKDRERWDPIDVDDIKTIKAYLVGQHPIVIGADVDTYKKEWHLNQEGITEKLLQRGVQYHAMVLIGYDDSKGQGAFEIMNSWGSTWNDNGYGWIAYSFWKEWITEAYVVRDKEPKKILAAGGLNGQDLKWLPPGPESKLNGNWGYPKDINLKDLKPTANKQLPEAVEKMQKAFSAKMGF